jgi:hypothetical protein
MVTSDPSAVSDRAAPAGRLPSARAGDGFVASRPTWLAARIVGVCMVFYFVGFLFADVYLKTLNTSGKWHPAHVRPSYGFGIPVLLMFVGTAASFFAGTRALSRTAWPTWTRLSALSLGLGLVGVVVLVVQLFRPGFAYGDGSYASVFVGWMWSLAILLLLHLYGVTSLVAQTRRSRTSIADETAAAGLGAEMAPVAEAVSFLLCVLAGSAVVAFIFLYLIR